MYIAKDFIETSEGLVFAVVWHGTENKRVLSFLRYVKSGSSWRKVSTSQANSLLQEQFPDYLYHSSVIDADLHGVPVDKIINHYQPRLRLQEIMQKNSPDPVEKDCINLCQFFQQHGLNLSQVGITGSLLIGTQNADSDIDLVIYNREDFHKARNITRLLIEENSLQPLDDQNWIDSYNRRSCDLSLEEYIWHEKRKINKGMINGRKFDLGMVIKEDTAEKVSYRKHGTVRLKAMVTGDKYAFDYPARFKIESDWADEVACFSATYTGQAVKGEKVEVSGLMEQAENGINRIVVGSSREAVGEYIKVIKQ